MKKPNFSSFSSPLLGESADELALTAVVLLAALDWCRLLLIPCSLFFIIPLGGGKRDVDLKVVLDLVAEGTVSADVQVELTSSTRLSALTFNFILIISRW